MSIPTVFEAISNEVESHIAADTVGAERRVQMADSLTKFVISAITKYYIGQQVHGGDICDRDLEMELRQEQIDQFWYSEAMKWRRGDDTIKGS